MTLAEIEACRREFLTPADVVDVLECNQMTLHWQAQNDPDALGFPVIVMGKRVKIPRRGFLHFMKYGRAPVVVEREAQDAKAV